VHILGSIGSPGTAAFSLYIAPQALMA